MACETDSEEEGQETRRCSGATIKMSSSTLVQEKSEQRKQTPQCLEEAMVIPPSGAITSPADDDGDIIPGESLIQGYILTECHSLTVELLDCPSAESLQPCALAALLCGFLNSGEEGAVYLGVRRSGGVTGLPLSKAGRQETRTQVCVALAHRTEPSLGGEGGDEPAVPPGSPSCSLPGVPASAGGEGAAARGQAEGEGWRALL